ncbi:hypothetical protein [Streptomyces rubiginosohelvolus]
MINEPPHSGLNGTAQLSSAEQAPDAGEHTLPALEVGGIHPVAAALHPLLCALKPVPTDDEGPRPSDATHDHLVAALTALGTPHWQTADSAGHYVVVDLPGSHVMYVHNPMREEYGFDWAITDDNAQQILTGTWWLGAADTAHRIQSLVNALPIDHPTRPARSQR